MTATVDDRFWSKVRQAPSGCWIWTRALDKKGYGRFAVSKRHIVLAHRWAYEALVAPIPDGLVLDHLCRVHACVNPFECLDPVTQAVNLARGEGPRLSRERTPVTHCTNGHEYTPENTYLPTRGRRQCRSCRLAAAHRYATRSRP